MKQVGAGMRPVLKTIFWLLMLFLPIGLLLGGSYLYQNYGKQILAMRNKARQLAAESTEDTFRAAQTSLVYAENGELISVLRAEKDVYYLDYAHLPKDAISAMLATEDRKFYSHSGFDVVANLRAAYSLIKNKGEIYQGGSTITQQLARNVFLSMEVTLERKVTELFLAAELEKKYTKNEIMEFYLNNIYFANGHYGLQAAAKGYFDESANALSLSQLAFLCTIPNNPTRYDPLQNFEATLARRDSVLLQMWEQGYISEEAYANAIAEEIVLDTGARVERKDYAETYTYHCAIKALMRQQGFVFRNTFVNEADKENYQALYDEAYYTIQQGLFTGGYRIYTSIDLELQEQLQRALDTELETFQEQSEAGVYTLQGAAVCIDNDTGRVAAIIGGRSQAFNGYTLNRAYQSFRQPGSSIKPLIVYTPWFERGLTPDDLVLDEWFEGGPRNSGDVYSGEITVRRAVEVSKNTVAWKLFTELTPQVGLSYLLDMNFARIVETDYVPAVALGGFTYGASALEMTAGFAALQNDGVYREPTCIIRITDAEGNAIVTDVGAEKRAYTQAAARCMTDVLVSVMENGTGRRLALADGMPSAGKTGTATGERDGWFIGYTRYYTTGVWVGYDMPKTLEGLGGNTYPGRIWQTFMNEIHTGLAPREFYAYE